MRLGVDPIPRRVDPEAVSSALYEITTHLPNDVLGALYKSDLGQAITAASNDPNWWFRRTQHLIHSKLGPEIDIENTRADWKFIYKSLDKYGFKFSWRSEYTVFLVELLLKLGADPTTDLAGRHVAKTGDLEALKALAADPRIDLSRDFIALYGAVEGGNLENVRFLLSINTQPPDDLAISAVEDYDIPMLQLLLSDDRIDPSVGNNYALREAVTYDYSDMVRILLEGDDRVLNAVRDWEELLKLAVDCGSASVVPIILKQEDKPYIGSALLRACRSDKNEIVKVLLDYVDPLQENEAFDLILPDGIRIAKNRQNVALIELLERKMTEMGWW